MDAYVYTKESIYFASICPLHLDMVQDTIVQKHSQIWLA